jgi:uncharacterized protein YjeT (DUF2065 family)
LSDTFLTALALMLIFEGLLPLVSPSLWRSGFKRLLDLKDGQLRFMGLIAASTGLLLLLMVS